MGEEKILLRERLLKAVYNVLLSIVKFLLRSGVTFDDFSALCKSAFVETALREYGIRGRLASISRVSAVTGIPRHQVSKIKKVIEKNHANVRSDLSPAGDVLHTWFTNQQYLGPEGEPLVLPKDGGRPSFDSLVKDSGVGVSASIMKRELQRMGYIETLADGSFRILTRHAIPDSMDEKLVSSIAFNFSGLAATIEHNSNPSRTSEGRIERSIISPNLPLAILPRVRADLRKRIAMFAEESDDLFSEYEREVGVLDSREPTKRVGVGVFFYEDE